MRYRFADFELDERAFELRRAGESIPIEPKPLRLLLHLLSRYPAATSRQELFDELWPGTAVTDNALSRAVRMVRAALGESAGNENVLVTVRGVGFRIGVAVEMLGAVRAQAAPGVSPTSSGAEPPAPRPELIGRARELELAGDALAAALAHRAELLLIAGEPGIGKTRLAQEIADVAAQRGARVLWGHAHDGEGAPAYWPWVQILRGYVDQCDASALQHELGEAAPAIAEVVPEIAARVRHDDLPRDLDPAQARFRFFDGVTRFLRRAASGKPLVLVLDDLHWADEPSLLLLEFVSREIAPAALLLVGTYRDTELTSPALERTIAAAARQERGSGCMTLARLARADVEQLLAKTLSDEPSGPLVDTIYDRSEGNPFFAHELTRLLPPDARHDDERVRQWARVLPPGLQQLLQRRIDAVSSECRGLLEAGAVIGSELSHPLLARVLGVAGEDILDLAHEAERLCIIEPTEGGLQFTHALLADALYQGLSPREKMRLHQSVGEALIAHYGGEGPALEPVLSEVARHRALALPAGDPATAIDTIARAARVEWHRLAFEETVHHCERGLQLLATWLPGDAARRCDLLELLAEGQFHCGDREAASESLWKLSEAGRAAGDGEQLARAAVGLTMWQFFTADTHRDVVAVIEDALALLPPDGSAARAKMLACLARQLTWSERYPEREGLAREAVRMARALDEPDTLIEVLGAFASLLEAIGGDDERQEIYDELGRLAERLGVRVDVANAHLYRAQHMIELARPADFERERAAQRAIAEEIRHPHHIAFAARLDAMRALWCGELGRAEALVFDAFEKGQRSDPSFAFGAFSAQLGALRRSQGRLAELEPALLEAVRRYPMMSSFPTGLAFLYANEDRRDEAARAFAEIARDDFEGLQPNDYNYRLNLALLAEVCAYLRDEAAAESLYTRLFPFRGRIIAAPTVVAAGCGSRHLGLLAGVGERWDEAESALEEAIAIEERMQAAAFATETRLDLAALRLRRGAPGDAERARAGLLQVEQAAQALGLTRLAQRATTLHPRI